MQTKTHKNNQKNGIVKTWFSDLILRVLNFILRVLNYILRDRHNLLRVFFILRVRNIILRVKIL